MDSKKRWKQAQQFLRDCTQEHTHIFHDSDADGIGAGLLMLRCLTDMGAAASSTTRATRADILSREELELVKHSYDPQRIIIIDLNPVDYGAWDDLREVFKNAEVLVIDHHRVTELDDAVFLHPEQLHGIDGSKYCSAKLTLDLCSSVQDVSAYEWLAAVGIIGDRNAEYFADVIVRSLEREGFVVPDDVELGETQVVNDAIRCCGAVGDVELVDYVNELSACRTLREASLLGNPCSEVREFVHELVGAGLEESSVDGPVRWLFVDSEYAVVSWVGTALSVKHPDELFVVYQKRGEEYKLSFRWQRPQAHCGDLARSCAKAVGGSGGGHRPASSALIGQDRFEEFQLCVRESVEQALDE